MKIDWKSVLKVAWAPVVFVGGWFGKAWLDAYNEQHRLTENTDQQLNDVISFVTSGWFIAISALGVGFGLGLIAPRLFRPKNWIEDFLDELRDLCSRIEEATNFALPVGTPQILKDQKFAELQPRARALSYTAKKAGFKFPELTVYDRYELIGLLQCLRHIEPSVASGHIKEARDIAKNVAKSANEAFAERMAKKA